MSRMECVRIKVREGMVCMQENYLKQELYTLLNTDGRIFEFIQSGSLDGIWYWDLEKPENEWMSPKFWTTIGYDPDEKKHMASEWQHIIFQDDLKLAMENFRKHCQDPNHPYDQIVRYRHKNGSIVWIRCRGMAIRDANGKPIRMLGAHVDISELKEAEREISRLTDEYEKVFNGTQDAMFLIQVLEDGSFRYVRSNLSHQNKTKISLAQITNQSPQTLLGEEVGNIVAENYRNCINGRTSMTYEEKLDLPGGNFIWLTTLTPIFEGDVVTHIVGSAEDITVRKRLELELETYANYDKLTGLPNRRLFFERLEQIVLECKRDKGSFALLFLDLDGFKAINDEYGHEIGDEVLIAVGKRLAKSVRASDMVARMGGDEFTAIIRNSADKEAVAVVADKIHKSISKPIRIGETTHAVHVSIGIAIYPESGKDSKTLLRNADVAMYAVKRAGKGGYGK